VDRRKSSWIDAIVGQRRGEHDVAFPVIMSPELGDFEKDTQALNLLSSSGEFGIEVTHERMRDARDATISNPVYRGRFGTPASFLRQGIGRNQCQALIAFVT
jgi:hypothetical protein